MAAMALSLPLSTSLISSIKHMNLNEKPNSFSLYNQKTLFSKSTLQLTRVQALKSDGSGWKKRGKDDEDESPKENDPYVMTLEERQEWRRKIRQVMDKKPQVEEVVDTEEKKKKMQKLISDYQLVVEEEDPNWPQDADGWGFSLGQFFDKITIQNKKKEDDDDDKPIVWQDDNYIRPIKDIKAAQWEETVFKDISPLIILVHNRYRRFLFNFSMLFLLFLLLLFLTVLEIWTERK